MLLGGREVATHRSPKNSAFFDRLQNSGPSYVSPEQEFYNKLSPEEKRQWNSLPAEQRQQIIADYSGEAKKPSLADLAKEQGSSIAGAAIKDQIKQAVGGQTASAVASNAGGVITHPVTGEAIGSMPASGAAAQAPGMFSMSGIGSAGNAILPAAGAAGLFDLYKDRESREAIGTSEGYLQGAASGAAMGSYFGPVGAGVGAGLGLAANVFGIGGASRTKGEEKQREALAAQGIMIPNSDVKEWENNEKFRDSRQESDLTGKDIINASDFYNIGGYNTLDAAKQEAIANKALELKLVQEKLGKINVGQNAEFDAFLKTQFPTEPATPTGSSRPRADTRQIEAEAKKDRKKAQLAQIMPDLYAAPTVAPNYGVDTSALIRNPYL